MSALYERFLTIKYGSEQDIQKILRNENFSKEYSNKKYSKLNFDFLKKLYRTKFLISKNNFQMLKTKTLLELFISIKTLFELKQKKNKKQTWIKKADLLKIGFKNSSLKYGIKKLIDLGLIDKKVYKHQSLIKLTKTNLKTKQNIYIKIENEQDWKIFLLFGLKTLYIYKILKFKSNFIKNKNSTRNKIVFQNALFDFNRSSTYKYLKSICNFLMLKFKNIFSLVRKRKKIFITCNNSKQKFISYKFTTERMLLIRI